LPTDNNISSSIAFFINDSNIGEKPREPCPPVINEPPYPNSQSIVPNLDTTATEADLILNRLASRDSLSYGLPAPSIRLIPIDKAAARERVFAIVFLILYLTGRADFNAPWIRKIDL
jgi:hypothetical protein